MAKAVENSTVVCCFMTKKYQESDSCRKELEYASHLKKRIIPCVLVDKAVWEPSSWLGLITSSLQHVNFSDGSEAKMRIKVTELADRIKGASQTIRRQAPSKRGKLC